MSLNIHAFLKDVLSIPLHGFRRLGTTYYEAVIFHWYT